MFLMAALAARQVEACSCPAADCRAAVNCLLNCRLTVVLGRRLVCSARSDCSTCEFMLKGVGYM